MQHEIKRAMDVLDEWLGKVPGYHAEEYVRAVLDQARINRDADRRCTCGHHGRDHDSGRVCLERDRSTPCGCAHFKPKIAQSDESFPTNPNWRGHCDRGPCCLERGHEGRCER